MKISAVQGMIASQYGLPKRQVEVLLVGVTPDTYHSNVVVSLNPQNKEAFFLSITVNAKTTVSCNVPK
jgi:hypothetical protein